MYQDVSFGRQAAKKLQPIPEIGICEWLKEDQGGLVLGAAPEFRESVRNPERRRSTTGKKTDSGASSLLL